MTSLAEALNALHINVSSSPEPPALPACEYCQGTGYIRFKVETTDPRFGKMFPCDNPDCPVVKEHHRFQAENVMQYSTWEEDYGKINFNDFWAFVQAKGAAEGKRAAFAAAYTFARSGGEAFTLAHAADKTFNQKFQPKRDALTNCILLAGEVGTGKTWMSIAAVNALREQAEVVAFKRTLELIKDVQAGYNARTDAGDPDVGKASSLLRFYSEVKYLVLDEFGVKNYANDRLEIIETIIRARHRASLPTIITTNLTLKEINLHWSKQVGDIVATYHYIEVGGDKLRDTAQEAELW